MAIEKETYVIGGPFKIRESGATAPFQFAGLVSTIQQTIETNEITLPDTTTPQGGEYDAVSRITSVGLSINFRELKTSILAALVWGDATNVPSATHTDEAHTAVPGGTIALDFMPLEITSVKSDDGTTTYEEFDDWNMTGAGIEIVEGGAISAATPIKVTYKSATVDVIEALTNSGKTFEFLFEGENAAGTQRRIQARYFRCRLNPSSQQDWINTEDFLAAEATAKVLMDPAKVGAGKSKYFNIKKELATV
ncbi:hypothetical protein [Pseudomonas aeruginosa]|uniref:phage tail tube protein n=1 Tax=Pseudomonas aeruginosa TaxID=287 RepID=UPI00053E284C|nr:hypothetical protein [Pseudomonas aeruginosa]MBO3067546.1 hypothetical protein [Pseudomonas aeruginosa]RQI00736.1 hypothetical protein IPC97_00615 [Pseudomonas aeruginosa]CRO80912.1 hypothetical protein PAERUG_P34_London_28_VIM_2_02_12_04390 [Pseudomonas aeruginosa]CRP81924.1 hypothetical protein PAERUG_P30_South_East_2_VIM_2_10_11_04586 [Pseudomonas aeruginosa]HCE9499793.1 hypothetical protein [Pseudomonas aeruginosa]